MTGQNHEQHELWCPHTQRDVKAELGPDAIFAGSWLDKPAHATRYVDLCAAYRALSQANMGDRLFDAQTYDLADNLKRYPHIEHLTGVRMTYTDNGSTIVLGEGANPPLDKRHVEQLCAQITLRKGEDPPRSMRVPADIAFLGAMVEDGFVLGRGTDIIPDDAAHVVMEVFGAEIEMNAAMHGEGHPERPRNAAEEEAVRILHGKDDAVLRRVHNIARAQIEPVIPAERGVWIRIDSNGHVEVGFQ